MDRTACTEPQCLYKGALYVVLLPTLLESCKDGDKVDGHNIKNIEGVNLSGETRVFVKKIH